MALLRAIVLGLAGFIFVSSAFHAAPKSNLPPETLWGTNQPVQDYGWPDGALAMANLHTRNAWRAAADNDFYDEGFHFEYTCTTTTQFNEALATFSKIHAPRLELTVYVNRPKFSHFKPSYVVDWIFTVYNPEKFFLKFRNPKFFRDWDTLSRPVPPPSLTVYLGSYTPINWDEVKIPANIIVIDKRRENQWAPRDRTFTVQDMATGKFIPGATVEYRVLTSKTDSTTFTQQADAQGIAHIHNFPTGYCYTIVSSPGYLSRGYRDFGDIGTSDTVKVELIKPASLRGIVVDAGGKPLEGVDVSTWESKAIDFRDYDWRSQGTTDREGRFTINLPQGSTRLMTRKDGYNGYTNEIYNVPSSDVRIVMEPASDIRGRIKNIDHVTSTRLMISIAPAGTWGYCQGLSAGGEFVFHNVPAGRYTIGFAVWSHPIPAGINPVSRTIDFKPGDKVVLDFEADPELLRDALKKIPPEPTMNEMDMKQ